MTVMEFSDLILNYIDIKSLEIRLTFNKVDIEIMSYRINKCI